MNQAELTTDGWRGTASSAWSELDVLHKAAAFVANIDAGQIVIIGYDGRAGSHELAVLAARAFTNAGMQCVISSSITPTPAVGRYVADHPEVGVGLIFTASHNPPGDFGLKVRLAGGLPPLTIPKVSARQKHAFAHLRFTDGAALTSNDRINQHYYDVVGKPLTEACADFPGEVVFDAVFGAVGSIAHSFPAIRWRRDIPAPFFFGITPDPVLREAAESEMRAALAACKHPERAVVFMTDGDGDRLCLYTETSGYVTSTEQAMALLQSGLPVERVISTCVVESTLQEIARQHGAAYHWTQVGFKNIVADWKANPGPLTMGIEPNGGLAIAKRSTDFFERDGLATAQLLLSHFGSVASLDAALQAIRAQRRFDSRQFTSPMQPPAIVQAVTGSWPGAHQTVHEQVYELRWPTGWRILVRRSGTEPITRCYVEGDAALYAWFANGLVDNENTSTKEVS